MKLRQHLDIGNIVLSNNMLGNFNINKKTYLLGNIMPELILIKHSYKFNTTKNRLHKLIKMIDSSSTNIVKSFTLGLITHYICDYFCYGNNPESSGVSNREYEDSLYKYYKSHLDEIMDNKDDLLSNWLYFKEQSKEKCIKDQCLTSQSHIEFIVNQINSMRTVYKNSDELTTIEHIQRDIKYSTFMIKHVLTIVLEPFKCMVGEF